MKIFENYSLKEHTTLKIGGNAKIAYFPENVNEVCELKESFGKEKFIIIGEGSNLLISSQGVEEKLIFTKNLNNIEFIDENIIVVESGTKSAVLAKAVLEKGLTGLEFLIGIPGSVGGAVTMNSSAHGQAVEDTIISAKVIDLFTGEIKDLAKDDLKLSYRHSFVEKNRHLILSATFKLQKADKAEIQEKMNFHLEYRKNNHPPIHEHNAGSTFRNPMRGVHAGKLFEDLGAKNWKEGEAGVSHKHANFLINHGNATSLDISRLMNRMYTGVKDNYGYDLIAEIRYLGKPTQEEEEIWKKFTVH